MRKLSHGSFKQQLMISGLVEDDKDWKKRGNPLILGTLSSRNADGDGDADTCEKTRERTPLWWEFTNIKVIP